LFVGALSLKGEEKKKERFLSLGIGTGGKKERKKGEERKKESFLSLGISTRGKEKRIGGFFGLCL